MSEWTFSNCSACTGMGCCIEYNVTIIGRDAYIVSRGLHLPVHAFTYYFEQQEKSSTGFVLTPGGPTHDFAIAKRVEGTRDGHSPCAFLMDLPEGLFRCAIYELRPLVCRTYPGTQYRGVVQFRRAVKCPSTFYDISKVDLSRWQPLLAELRFEYDLYERLVALWNARVEAQPKGSESTIFAYHGFLINFYHRTEALRTTARAEWLRACKSWGDLVDRGGNPLQLTEDDRQGSTGAGDEAFWRMARGFGRVFAQLRPRPG